MNGLELSKKFYEEWGAPMLQEQFAPVLPYLAVGLAGSGSECYGYDDTLSQDHDFEPAFCIFLPEEDVVDRKTAFLLERAYAKLPRQFMGFERSNVSAVGGNRHGVIRMGDFFEAKTGNRKGELTLGDWFTVPQASLLEAVNGAVFADHYGAFTAIRKNLSYFPEAVRLKKLCGHLLLMGQAGQYNYNRCLLRGETAAAQLAVFEFVKSTLNVIFLLNKTYMPYYKWTFRALKDLPLLSSLAGDLESLISGGNQAHEGKAKSQKIEQICAKIAKTLNEQGLSLCPTAEMEQQAYAVNDTIIDDHIRNLHILCAV